MTTEGEEMLGMNTDHSQPHGTGSIVQETATELAVETSYSTEAVVDEEQPQPPKVESPSFAAFGASKNIHLSQKFRESVNRHSNGSQSEGGHVPFKICVPVFTFDDLIKYAAENEAEILLS